MCIEIANLLGVFLSWILTEEVFELCVGRLSRGLAASTLLTCTTIMRTSGVRPFVADAVERRIRSLEEAILTNSI
jgi:hypothetical protein